MAALLAALAALVYGTADFAGGLASRRTHGVVVTLVSQAFGFAALLLVLAVWADVTVTGGDLLAGALAGIAGGLGLVCFYPALARGPMSVVAPATAVCSAVVPLTVGLASGERPATGALIGVALALPAIVLVARESGSHGRAERRTIGLAVAAGIGFGLFFVALSHADRAAGLWPLAAARVASITAIGALCLATRRRVSVARGSWPATVAAGVLDVAANALYLLAVTRGLLSLVAVLGSLYPATTVLLATLFLHERVSRQQGAGLVLAAGAVALIAAS